MEKPTNIEALILAGGKGERMKGDVPKPMEIVKNKPIINYGLEVLEKLNFNKNRIVCLVGHKGSIIRSHLGEEVKYAEHKDFSGNLGAVFDSLNTLDQNVTDVLVIQGDDCLFLDEKEMRGMLEEYERMKPDISLMLTEHTERDRTRFFLNSNKEVVDIESPAQNITAGLFTTGVFIFSLDILKKYLKEVEVEDREREMGIIDFVVTQFKRGKNICGFISKQPWIEVNNRQALEKASDLLNKNNNI